MKKKYEKPVLTKRDRLGSVTAQVVVISGPVA
ncbi:putative RiPP precursor (plasmid) [Mesorhizobium sp. AR02]|nr:putative RiPP precursor [Mesorhizobium sp. AR02]UVK57496.1 putative RiPP precursor [Mesorhizobium sp. AR02]